MAYRCNSGQFPYFGKEWGSRKGRVYKRMKRSEVKVNIPNPYNQLKYEFGVCYSTDIPNLKYSVRILDVTTYKLLFKIMPNLKKLPKDF